MRNRNSENVHCSFATIRFFNATHRWRLLRKVFAGADIVSVTAGCSEAPRIHAHERTITVITKDAARHNTLAYLGFNLGCRADVTVVPPARLPASPSCERSPAYRSLAAPWTRYLLWSFFIFSRVVIAFFSDTPFLINEWSIFYIKIVIELLDLIKDPEGSSSSKTPRFSLYNKFLIGIKVEIRNEIESGTRTEIERTNDIDIMIDGVIGRYKRRTNSFDIHAGEAADKSSWCIRYKNTKSLTLKFDSQLSVSFSEYTPKFLTRVKEWMRSTTPTAVRQRGPAAGRRIRIFMMTRPLAGAGRHNKIQRTSPAGHANKKMYVPEKFSGLSLKTRRLKMRQ
ncbi:hypothetical protein EVAR_8543_1 [Eumeta japonica]|uniref:Uncharacterized protein n=1 Tax=Eumeta variegata TaxID=151549 RepID=A0A4C1TXI2_EUMVA|nr:hypothetical protein EVAR_8543_1 [Eumeta japonica]